MMMTFHGNVLSVVKTIPPGQYLTYKQVAARAGRLNAYRAVGNILNKNSDRHIPCHRVVRSNGSIGGFNRGEQKKRSLLLREHAFGTVLRKSFFERPVLIVAKQLLGKYLVRRNGNGTLADMITEVEAYDGPDDRASHAYRGKTPRNAVMFDPAGHWYIYFVYGMYWMLNIVTGPINYPAAVLIRSTETTNGPGRLTKRFRITKGLNKKASRKHTGLWIEDRRVRVASNRIKRTKRIGVEYAGREWANKPFRFVLKQT